MSTSAQASNMADISSFDQLLLRILYSSLSFVEDCLVSESHTSTSESMAVESLS